MYKTNYKTKKFSYNIQLCFSIYLQKTNQTIILVESTNTLYKIKYKTYIHIIYIDIHTSLLNNNGL